MLYYGNASSMRHIYGKLFDKTRQPIFLKSDARNQGHSGRLTVNVQPPRPHDVFTK